MALTDFLHTYPGAENILRSPNLTHAAATRILNSEWFPTSETAVRRWRAANDVIVNRDQVKQAKTTPAGTENVTGGVRAEEDPEGLTVYHDSWPVQLGEDLGPLIEFFGYDPKHFTVVDDTVKMSKWQQSKGTDDGGRDVIWLYSYKARFERIKEPLNVNTDLDSVLVRIRSFKPRFYNLDRPPVIYVHQQGDEQIGKAEGGGLEGVAKRAEDAINQSYDRLTHLLKTNPSIAAIADVANGDVVENIFGHYPSQQRTTATLRKQFQAGRDLDLMRTEMLASFGLPIHKIYTTDNHGEMRQKIGLAPFTSESDNLALILAESVKDVVVRSPLNDLITWHIPHDEWWTNVEIEGVNFSVGHGHKATGKLEQWVKDQRDMLHMHEAFRADLMLLGHKHHFLAQDISGTTLIQTPSLDGGSPFFAAMKGNISRPGVVTYLAGKHFNQFFSDLVVL